MTRRSGSGIWKAGRTLRTLEGHASYVLSVAVTPDGRRAISASNDRMLRVWDLESAQTQLVLEGHEERVSAVALTLDGNYAVSASHDRTLRLWDLKTGRPPTLPGPYKHRAGCRRNV